MTKIPIYFFSEQTTFAPKKKNELRKWIKESIQKESHHLYCLNFIFCSDKYLLQINSSYLNHYTLTDIITFNNSDDGKSVQGDIFISYSRVKENALAFSNGNISEELHRVMIHGVLHLLGYKDKTPAQKAVMTEKENFYLKQRKFK